MLFKLFSRLLGKQSQPVVEPTIDATPEVQPLPNVIKLVFDWMFLFNHVPNLDNYKLYTKLIREELSELDNAQTPEEMAKEAGDLLWVTLGKVLQILTPEQITEVIERIYVSNMSKAYPNRVSAEAYLMEAGLFLDHDVVQLPFHYAIKRKLDGKIVKGGNYKPAVLPTTIHAGSLRGGVIATNPRKLRNRKQ